MRSAFVGGFVIICHLCSELGNDSILDLVYKSNVYCQKVDSCLCADERLFSVYGLTKSSLLPEALLCLSQHELNIHCERRRRDVQRRCNPELWNNSVPQMLK